MRPVPIAISELSHACDRLVNREHEAKPSDWHALVRCVTIADNIYYFSAFFAVVSDINAGYPDFLQTRGVF